MFSWKSQWPFKNFFVSNFSHIFCCSIVLVEALVHFTQWCNNFPSFRILIFIMCTVGSLLCTDTFVPLYWRLKATGAPICSFFEKEFFASLSFTIFYFCFFSNFCGWFFASTLKQWFNWSIFWLIMFSPLNYSIATRKTNFCWKVFCLFRNLYLITKKSIVLNRGQKVCWG